MTWQGKRFTPFTQDESHTEVIERKLIRERERRIGWPGRGRDSIPSRKTSLTREQVVGSCNREKRGVERREEKGSTESQRLDTDGSASLSASVQRDTKATPRFLCLHNEAKVGPCRQSAVGSCRGVGGSVGSVGGSGHVQLSRSFGATHLNCLHLPVS